MPFKPQQEQIFLTCDDTFGWAKSHIVLAFRTQSSATHTRWEKSGSLGARH
jgi:hypothetical protein